MHPTCLFPRATYPDGLFPNSLFPGIVEEPVIVPPGSPGSGYGTVYGTPYATPYLPGSSSQILAADFVSAVRARLKADQQLEGLVPGDWWYWHIPRKKPYPAGLLMILGDNRHQAGGDQFLESGTFQISAYAQRAQTAVDIADRATAVLTDAPLRWEYEKGRLMYFTLSSPVSSEAPGRGPGGSDLFVEVRLFDYVYQGTELKKDP
jgi:hypothetical protein